MGHTRNPSFRYEDLGDELLVCDPASGTVVRLVNGDADALRGVLTSPSVSLRHPGADPAALERLAEAGIVVADDAGSNLTRRRVLQLSAAGAAAAGLAVVALPNAAAASSPEPPSPTSSTTAPPPAPVGSISFTVFTGPESTGSPVSVTWLTGSNEPFTWKVTAASGVTGVDFNQNYNSGFTASVIGTRTDKDTPVTITVVSNTDPPATRFFP